MKINEQRQQLADQEKNNEESSISNVQLSEINLNLIKPSGETSKNHNFIEGTWKKSKIKSLIEAEIASKSNEQLEIRLKQMIKAKEAVQFKIDAIPIENTTLLVIFI